MIPISPPPHPSPQAQALVVALLVTAIALGVEQDFKPLPHPVSDVLQCVQCLQKV